MEHYNIENLPDNINIDYKSIKITDDILSRWENSGFLDGINCLLKEKCALSFERMGLYLLIYEYVNDKPIDKDEAIYYAIVRKVVEAICDDVMPELIVNKVGEYSNLLTSPDENIKTLCQIVTNDVIAQTKQLTAFEDAVKDLMNDYRDAIGDNDATTEEVKKHSEYLLSLIPQKTAEWSEEDKNILEAITYTVKNSGYSHCIGVSIEVMIDWLKSIKERMK